MQILRAGGIPPIVLLLTSPEDATQCSSAIAIQLLARDCPEIQDALASEKACAALTQLLSAESLLTQESAVGALLCLSVHPPSRTVIIVQLVGVLASRSTSFFTSVSTSCLPAIAGNWLTCHNKPSANPNEG